MEQNQNRLAPAAPADESASPFNPSAEQGADSDPPLISDSLDTALQDTLDATFTPDGRKPRHDGWTPEAVAGFLHALAETGVIEHAARRVGLSAQAAYAFRNRRQGRAFAKMWDAVLVNRARARIEGELQGRAIAGCVSIRKRDGVVVGEYHYYDNRLAMSLLTRLDRIAEREEASEAHLRALSEDLDDFCDCLAEGGDPDAFVEARRPEDNQEKEPEMPTPADDPDDQFAILDADIPLTGDEVWEDEDGEWWTVFPPPAFFNGVERDRFGDPGYRRTLSDDEREVIDETLEDREAQELAREAGRRDRYFGFDGGLANGDWHEPDENPAPDEDREPDDAEEA
jgi:hypothetical protein